MAEPTEDLAALSYEELVDELERLTELLASGEIGIEEATDLYERAGRVYQAASERLEAVAARIEKLKGPAGG
jgi:exodeoxyribonuclease VII small subunit